MKRLLVLATVGLFVLCLGSAYGYDLEETLAYDYEEDWTTWGEVMVASVVVVSGLSVIFFMAACYQCSEKVKAQKEINEGELRRLRMEERELNQREELRKVQSQLGQATKYYLKLTNQQVASRKLAEKLLESLGGTVAGIPQPGPEFPKLQKKEIEEPSEEPPSEGQLLRYARTLDKGEGTMEMMRLVDAELRRRHSDYTSWEEWVKDCFS